MARVLFSFLTLLATSGFSFGAPVDLSPPSATLGAASSDGYVLIVREVDEVDFGNGLKLPVRIQFKSQRSENSKFLGAGWKIPILESSCALYKEGMMGAELPCGKRLWLFEKKRGSLIYETLDGQWKGITEDKTFTISRKDGWQIKYVDGSISLVKTDDGRLLQWIYDGKKVIELTEGKNNALKVIQDQEGRFSGLIINDRRHAIQLGQRPRIIETAGKRLVEALDPVLNAWIFPGGAKEEFDFAINEDLYPTMTMLTAKREKSEYSWNPGTGYIRSDGDWKYTVGLKEGKFGLPPLERKNSAGASESVFIDSKTGVTTRIEPGGVKTISYRFKAPGPLYNKLQKVDRVSGEDVKNIYTAAYDEKGALLRKKTKDGVITILSYDKEGNLTDTLKKFPASEEFLSDLTKDEKALLESIKIASTEDDRIDAIQNLAFFYIYKAGNSEKALALISKDFSSGVKFNIKFNAIEGNATIVNREKIPLLEGLLKEFPGKKDLLNNLIEDKKKRLGTS